MPTTATVPVAPVDTIKRLQHTINFTDSAEAANNLRQLNAASGCGIDSVIVGKALYEGRFTLEDAIASTRAIVFRS
ncbi:MAG TPA: hypothetical protein VGJ48_20765 [Pyrinomonadaceae bacterium]